MGRSSRRAAVAFLVLVVCGICLGPQVSRRVYPPQAGWNATPPVAKAPQTATGAALSTARDDAPEEAVHDELNGPHVLSRAAPHPATEIPTGRNFDQRLPFDDLLHSGLLLDESLSDPDPDGWQIRSRLLETDFQYPYIEIRETVRSDPTGREELRLREALVADHMIVQLSSSDDHVQLEALNQQFGNRVRTKMFGPNLYLVEFPEPKIGAADSISAAYRKATASIAIAEPDYLVSASLIPNDPSFSSLWGLHNPSNDADIDAPEAWDQGLGSTDVIVGVIDTGVDYNHPDLASRMWQNPGEIAGNGVDDDTNGFVDDVYGRDFVNGDSDPMDDNNHGTHCAGTIGAAFNNGTGVAGVAPRVKMIALKFLSASGSGSTSGAVQAVYYANAKGARLTSNSWGGGSSSSSLQAAINAAADQGRIFVAAAGNSNSNNDAAPQFPSSYSLTSSNVIAVASTTSTDARSSFSNWGATSVNIGAPGSSIFSTVRSGGYATFSGTSMATPHVAGAIAHLWAIEPSASIGQVKNCILSTGDSIAALAGITTTGKRLNLNAAVSCIRGGLPPEPTNTPTPTPTATSTSTGGVPPTSTPQFTPTSAPTATHTPIPPPTPGGDVTVDSCVVDDSDLSNSPTAHVRFFAESGWNGNPGFHSKRGDNNGSNSATWVCRGLRPGLYDVLVQWQANADWTDQARHLVVDSDTGRIVHLATVNQRVAPSGPIDEGGLSWHSLLPTGSGGFSFYGKEGRVILRGSAPNGFVIANRVRFQRIGDIPASAPPAPHLASAIFIDDADPSVQLRGWSPCSPSAVQRHFDNGCHQSSGTRTKGFLRFPLGGVTRGVRYDVYSTWLERGDLSSKVTLRLKMGKNVQHDLRVDQTLPPTNLFFGRSWADPASRDIGVAWRLVGSFISDGSPADLSVISPGRDQFGVGDGVMIVPQDGVAEGSANFAFPRAKAFKDLGREIVRRSTTDRAIFPFTKGLPLLQTLQGIWTLDGQNPGPANLPVVAARWMVVGPGGDVQLVQAAPANGVYIFKVEVQGLGNTSTREQLAIVLTRNGIAISEPLQVDAAGLVNGYLFIPVSAGEQAGLQLLRSGLPGDARIRLKIWGVFGGW